MADETPVDQPTPEATAILEAPENTEGKLLQTVDIKDVGPCKKHVVITVDRAAIDVRMQEKFDELMKDDKVQIPGFRPGKAPRKFFERKFKSYVKEDVRREVLMASLQQLADDTDLAPLAPPQLDPEKLEIPDEGPFVYEFEVEVRPEFDMPDYKGLKLRKGIRKFTRDEILREQRRVLEDFSTLVPKEGDASVALDDIIVCDLTVVDGDKELSKANEVRIRVEKTLALTDGLVTDFGSKVSGAKAGETKNFDLVLGDSVADEALKGKTVSMSLNIKDVKVVRLPELTPALLTIFGVTNTEQLEEKVEAAMLRNVEYQQQQSYRQQIVKYVSEKVKWDLPRDLVLRQSERSLQRRVMEMRSAGMSDVQISSRMTILRQNAVQSTMVSLVEHFILQKVAEAEKIDIKPEDLDDEIGRIAELQGESFRKLKAQMERNDQLETLATELLERKALDVILNNAEYEEYELQAADEAGEVAAVPTQAIAGDAVQPQAE